MPRHNDEMYMPWQPKIRACCKYNSSPNVYARKCLEYCQYPLFKPSQT